MARDTPNIIITGTPGVGKSSHCELLAQNTGLKHMSVNRIVKEHDCHQGWDGDLESWIVDEDKLLDTIESDVSNGGQIIEWHGCEMFPQSWIDLVVVLRTDPTLLYDRLTSRNYPQRKLQENLDSEIMQVLLEEARESYDEDIVVELTSDASEDIESNVDRIKAWITNWQLMNSDKAK